MIGAVLAGSLACGPSSPAPGARPYFSLASSDGVRGHFFDYPFPSDLRLDDDGTPNLEGYPAVARGDLLASLVAAADRRSGFSTMPVVYFRFSEPLRPRTLEQTIAARADSPILIVDIDPTSPDRGRLYPSVAESLMAEDTWSPGFVLAVTPYPGVVLAPGRRYAVVITTDVRAEDGRPVVRAPAIKAMSRGQSPGGPRASEQSALFAPLWSTLDELGVARDSVAVATVFTTGDVVAELDRLATAAQERYWTRLEELRVDPEDGADHDRFCEVLATASLPQFQTDTPPFNNGGVLNLDELGTPEVLRAESVDVVLTIPKTPMPEHGYPLMLYYHGSGGVPSQLVDRGRKSIDEPDPVGTGPAHVVAEHGIAGFAPALPLSPARLPGASEQEYLNFANLGAFPDTFRQGVIEQRLLLDAVLELSIPRSAIAACEIPGSGPIHFDERSVVASGQSMGGMYTNMVAATEKRVRAAVPTGAGGLWHWMLLGTNVLDDIHEILGLLFETNNEGLSSVHPSLGLLALAWEPAEPLVFMPRLAKAPLPGHPSRAVYQPIGFDDVYFPTYVFDAAVVSTGSQLAGEEVWGGTQQSLSVAGLDGVAEYPVTLNRVSESGQPVTSVAVQYTADPYMNAHYIFAQLDEVKYQYGCFLATLLSTGNATVPAPAALGTPCPN